MAEAREGQASAGAPRPAAARSAAVFLNGAYADDESFLREVARGCDLVIGVDGGTRHALAAGLRPDLVVGDLDSLDEPVVERLRSDGVGIVRHPVRKDETDAELAAQQALACGVSRLVLLGGLGEALDHTLGHLALLRRLNAAGVDARLTAPRETVVVLAGGDGLRLSAQPGRRFSLAPLTATAVVSLEGFEYELRREVLHADRCRGLGNRVIATGAQVRIHEGTVVVLTAAFEPAPVLRGL